MGAHPAGQAPLTVDDFALRSPAARADTGKVTGVLPIAVPVAFALALSAMFVLVRRQRQLRVDLAAATRRFRDLAAADELTGLGNRSRLLEDLDFHISRGRRYGNTFAVIQFDVDGDEVGEEDLADVAEVVRENARGADRCYRLGARVLALLPEQGVAGALVAAERGRAAVTAACRVTCSVGVAAWVPWEDDTPQDVLARVASVARTSARHGGNRITVAEPTRA